MRSMTGFGQATQTHERFRAEVRLRTVNHRGLDLHLRLPEELVEWEPAVRGLLAGELERGRVELTVRVEPKEASKVEIRVREEALESLARVVQELGARGLVRSELRWGDLVRLPEIVQVEASVEEWTDTDRKQVMSVVEDALVGLIGSREREGKALVAAFLQRLAELEHWLGLLEQRRQVVVAGLGKRLRERLRSLAAEIDVADERLAQEVAILVEKADITEELDRLRAHVEHFREILEQPGSNGRRLNFLCQEILRELNTLGAKSRDTEMTQATVEGKVICEQMREQVQNVE